MSRPSPESPPDRLWTPRFAALLAAQVFFGYAFSSFFLLPTFLSLELDASATEVGQVMSVASAAVVLLLPIMGHGTDRFGRRGFLALGGLLMGLASLGFLWVESIGPLIYALRLVHAVAFSMSFAAGGALAVDLAPPARVGQAVGLFGLTFLAMNGVASAVVERIAEYAGWGTAFATAGAAGLVSSLLSSQLRPGPEGRPRETEGVTPRVGPAPALVPPRALLIMASIGLACGTMFSFAQLYALTLGYTDVSLFFVAYAATGVLVRAGFGHLFDAWGVRRVATASLVLYVIVVAATVWLDRLGLVLIGCGFGLAHGVFYPSFTAVALGAASAGARGRVIAYTQAAFSVGATASAALGVVADTLGYAPVFLLPAFALAGALWLLVHIPRSRAAAPDPALQGIPAAAAEARISPGASSGGPGGR